MSLDVSLVELSTITKKGTGVFIIEAVKPRCL